MRTNRNNLDKFFDYGINMDTKTLYLNSEVEEITAAYAIKGLHLLDNLPNEKELTIILNSVGGDVYHGMAIYDYVQSCKSHVVIKVFGQAMSMGAVILQAGDERLLSHNARLMIHYGTMSVDDHVKNFHRWSDESKKLDKLFEDILLEKIKVRHPRYTKTKIQSMLQFDTILDAKESIAIGLADSFI